MKRQQGISMAGFIGFLLIAGFVAFLAMRLFPVYSEYHSVVTAMKGLAADPAAAGKGQQEIRQMLAKRLQISYVSSVKPEHVSLRRANGQVEVVVAYEVRRPLAYNLDFVASFEKTVVLRPGGAMPE